MHFSRFDLISYVGVGILFTLTSVTAKPSDFIKTCRQSSRECLKESLQATIPRFTDGIPELGIEVLDPFVVHNLNLTLPGDLKVNFRDGVATGFKDCIIDKARMIKDVLEVHLHCDLTVKGKYSSSGSFLMFPIDGSGDSAIKCKNIKFATFFKLGSKMEKGQKHFVIKSLKVEHRFDGHVHYQLSNLFKGSPEMSNLVLEFMNENWRMVAEEFGKPIVNYGVAAILKNIKLLLKNIPEKELIPTNTA